ncbi:hypothetical protein H0H81_003491 [Sphagnurus paluster]|uniref:Integrase catalytic domain-containing protein n=1 Tax=Sphagnurus paluster TaxID=117069 RepID=A0A9P7FRI4_9AGAR|nr:hypothetical protein H0H81_003491 [Sphagnurus paluster]
MDETTLAHHIYCRFGSITLNTHESRFSQPKLELYGIFQALGAFQLYIIKVDACYIKGMLSNPDIQPSASINRWITAILMFDFKLVHVKGTHHRPDGLSRWPPQPGDPEPTEKEDEEIFEDWVDRMYGFMHIIQLLIPPRPPLSIVEVFAGAQITIEEEDDDEEEADKAKDRLLPNHRDLKIRPVEPIEGEIPYKAVPRSYKAQLEDAPIIKVRKWLEDFKRPEGMEDKELATFVWFATGFFLDGNRLWRRHRDGAHQLFARPESRIAILKAASGGRKYEPTWYVTDNGTPFLAALKYLAETYGIRHIHISGYNSRANGLVKQAHLDTRQAMFKAMNGDRSKWFRSAYLVFWSERVTTKRRLGCSPYFAATGTLLPLDITEATYL